MQAIKKRELVRNPARLSELPPGESLRISDAQGGLVVTREKRVAISPEQMEAALQAICADGPATDARAMMEDEG